MLERKLLCLFTHQLDTKMKINLKKLEDWWDNTGFVIYVGLLIALFIWINIKFYLMGVHTWD